MAADRESDVGVRTILAALMNVPETQGDWSRWSFDHLDSHNRIRAAVKAQLGVSLTDYQLDPIAQVEINGFLNRNQQLHVDMEGVLRLQSTDLLDVDFNNERIKRAWFEVHYQAHYDAEKALHL